MYKRQVEKGEATVATEATHYKLTPSRLKGAAPKLTECPYGAAFGADFNEYEECRECEAREDCKNKKDELSAPKEEATTPDRKKLLRRKA